MPPQPLVVFVRGCARSGTTLLADIMNESPEIGLFVEQPLGDVARRMLDILWFEQHVRQRQAMLAATPDVAPTALGKDPSYRPVDHIGNLRRMRFTRRYPTRERFPAVVTAAVEASLEKSGLKVIGSKTPGHWDDFELRVVKELFHKVKYVFVVRNPLDTINSIVNRRNAARAGRDDWPDRPVNDAIAAYHESICLLLSCLVNDAGDSYVIGYEDLIADPAGTLASLSEFLGVDVHDGELVSASAVTKSVLSAEEEALVRTELGAAIAGWDGKRITGRAAEVAGAFDDCVRVVKIGKTYRCDAPVSDRGLLGSGWSGPEPRGIWSDAPIADMFFAVPQDGEYVVALEVVGYVPAKREPLRFGLSIDDRHFDCVLRNCRRTRLQYGPVHLTAGPAHRLSFSFENLRSPWERGSGQDRRRLGVCLRRFRIERR